jgi:hypothetical protein
MDPLALGFVVWGWLAVAAMIAGTIWGRGPRA